MKKMVFALVLLWGSLTAQDGYYNNLAEALQNKESATVLDLSSKGLDRLPEEIGALTKLRVLLLSNNKLSVLPQSLEQLHALEELDISFNPALNLSSLSQSFSGFPNLKSLDMEGCRVLYVPVELKRLTALEYLNMSHNHLKDINDAIMPLKNLTLLNVAFNHLDSVSAPLGLLPNLQKLDVSNNPSIVFGPLFGDSLQFTSLTQLVCKGNSSVPDVSNCAHLKEMDLSGGTFTQMNQSNPKGIMLDKLNLEGCNQYNMHENVSFLKNNVRQLALDGGVMNGNLSLGNNSEKLESVKVSGACANSVKFNHSKSIKEIAYEGKAISSVISNIADMDSLIYLDLSKTAVSKAEVMKIAEMYPNCAISKNQSQGTPLVLQNEKPGFRKVQAPIPALAPKYESKEVKSAEGAVMVLESGSTVQIPKNAFLDKKGKVVEGDVVVKVREFNDPLAVYLSGIPMTYDSTENSFAFKSAGMYEVKAEQKGKEVFPNPENPIIYNLNNPAAKEYEFFTFSEEKGKWERKALPMDSSYKEDQAKINWDSAAKDYLNFTVPKIPKKIEYQKVYVSTEVEPERNSFLIRLDLSKMSISTKSMTEKKIAFNDMSVFESEEWVYVGADPKEAREKLRKTLVDRRDKIVYDRIFYKVRPTVYRIVGLTDLYVTAHPTKDNMVLNLVTETDTIQFDVMPHFGNNNIKAQKKWLKRKWRAYKKQKANQDILTNKVLDKHHQETLTYEVAMDKIKLENPNLLACDSLLLSLAKIKKAAEPEVVTKGSVNKNKFVRGLKNVTNGVVGGVLTAGAVALALTVDVAVFPLRILTFGLGNLDLLVQQVDLIAVDLFDGNGIGKQQEAVYLTVDFIDENGKSLNYKTGSVITTNGNGINNFANNRLMVYRRYKNAVVIPLGNNKIAYLSSSDVEALTKNRSMTKVVPKIVSETGLTKVKLQELLEI